MDDGSFSYVSGAEHANAITTLLAFRPHFSKARSRVCACESPCEGERACERLSVRTRRRAPSILSAVQFMRSKSSCAPSKGERVYQRSAFFQEQTCVQVERLPPKTNACARECLQRANACAKRERESTAFANECVRGLSRLTEKTLAPEFVPVRTKMRQSSCVRRKKSRGVRECARM